MRTTQFLLATLKETPAETQIISHQLMLRAGMIRKLTSGVYTWLPLGLRVLQNVINIVRDEMNQSGALEMLLPSVQPAELWQETNRWEQYGHLLLRFKDRHGRDFCYGPTHEEVITDIMRDELQSYKQLPLNVYQIQTKFRDEIRPRFGVMRAREFTMKDAYSFHLTEDSLKETYQVMYDAYSRIFNRLGLRFRAVLADTGEIGGNTSHEFQVLADNGEDCIAVCENSDYAANIEKAESLPPQDKRPEPTQKMALRETPGTNTIKAVCDYLKVPATQSIKTLIVKGTDTDLVALLLRGDHDLNDVKAAKLPQVLSPLTFASDEEIMATFGCKPGFLGPIDCPIPVIADRFAAHLADFVCGANQKDHHYTGVNWGRDVPEPEVADLRNVLEGDMSPDGKGPLSLVRGIEVGHIFQLGDKYSQAMNATVLNENGKAVNLLMGCYGLGISRVIAAAIEQHHDEHGIIWPDNMAPFHVAIVPINAFKSERVHALSEELYNTLLKQGVSVLLDDRKERPGVKFADLDLIGIPHRIVISDKGLDNGTVEYKNRKQPEPEFVTCEVDTILKALAISHLA